MYPRHVNMPPWHPNRTYVTVNGSVGYDILPSEMAHGKGDNFSGLGVECPESWGTRCAEYPGVIKQLPQWEIALKLIFYVMTILVSIVGNVLVICIVWKNKRMRTTTNYYIVNLAVSDLLVTVSCTWVHLITDVTEGWVLGAFFCKFNSFAQGK